MCRLSHIALFALVASVTSGSIFDDISWQDVKETSSNIWEAANEAYEGAAKWVHDNSDTLSDIVGYTRQFFKARADDIVWLLDKLQTKLDSMKDEASPQQKEQIQIIERKIGDIKRARDQITNDNIEFETAQKDFNNNVEQFLITMDKQKLVQTPDEIYEINSTSAISKSIVISIIGFVLMHR